jgi:predicted ArsR family transcriptional regulator
MKAGTCKGCGPGNKVAAEVVAKKNCPVLNCASMKKIGFCGTECAMFAKCGKLVGRPYAQEFLDRIAAKLG